MTHRLVLTLADTGGWARLVTRHHGFALISGFEEVAPDRLSDAVTAIDTLPLPTVAWLPAATSWTMVAVALAADFRLLPPQGTVGLCGIGPDATGSLARLARLVGRQPALVLWLEAPVLSGPRALELGLIDELVAAEHVERARSVTALAAASPLALRAARMALREGAALNLSAALELEMMLYAALHASADRDEGLRAYRERRVPRFTGS